MTARHRTQAERDAAQARFDQLVEVETEQLRRDATELIASETREQQRARAAAVFAREARHDPRRGAA